jgi:DNA modification methylase
VLRAKPVIKFVRGENVHGHTAPYPEAIPLLLNHLLPAQSTILDPFGGSATTARALSSRHAAIVCVERSGEYCKLAREMCESMPEGKSSPTSLENERSAEYSNLGGSLTQQNFLDIE